ncbi:protein disulfide-isomerase domain [Cryptococcus sp. DSM 104549]
MRVTLPLALTAALAPLAAYAGMYAQPVLHLDATTFKTVMANEHAAMVAFVAPWCGHCKNLGPEYTAAAQSLSPLIPFYAVDCDDAANRGLCAQYGVQGYPTIKAFPKASKGAAKDYNGERKRGALAEYAKTLVPDRVKKLRADGAVEPVIQKFLDEKSDLPHVLLVHPSAPSIPFLWKVLAHRLSSKMHFAYIRDTTSHGVLSSLGIFDSSDTTRDGARVVAWPAGAQSRAGLVEYDGTLKFNGLLEWLQFQIDGTTPPPSSSGSPGSGYDSKSKQKPASAPKPPKPASDGTSSAAARRAKLEEAERRDRARREKAAAQAEAQARLAAQAEAGAVEEQDRVADGESERELETEEVASPVDDAPRASPEEGVEQEAAGAAVGGEGAGAAEPVPEEAPLDVESEEAEETKIVHEEL